MRALLVLALTGCLSSSVPAGMQNPYCPASWKYDLAADGYCSPPIGYTALVWAELGGSGVYGFVRAATPKFETCVSQENGSDAMPCESRMIAKTEIDAYNAADIVDTTIIPNALPVATTVSSSSGVYKLRLEPGGYRITGIDPLDGTRFWSANLTVVPQALATCAIDVYPQ